MEYRFTVKAENLYAIAQSWPGDTAVIASLAKGKALDGQVPKGRIKSVTLLGSPGKLKFTQDADGLKVKLPTDKPCDYAWTLKITGLKMNPAGAHQSHPPWRICDNLFCRFRTFRRKYDHEWLWGSPSRGHSQGRLHPHRRRYPQELGGSWPALSPAGRSITSKARRPIRTASTPRSPAAGSGRSSSAPTTAARPGRPSATSSPTTASPARTSGTTARRIPGSSSASGTSSPRSPIPTRSTPAWKTRRCSAPPTAAQTWQELSGLRGHGTGPALAAGRGRHVPAHHHPRSHQSRAHLHRHLRRRRLPHRRRRRDLEAHQQGPASRTSFPTPPPRSATACTTSPCTRRAPACSSCRSTGT